MIVKRVNSLSIELKSGKIHLCFQNSLNNMFLFLNNMHKFIFALAIMTTVVAVQTHLASAQPETPGNPIPTISAQVRQFLVVAQIFIKVHQTTI
jgi:hypothetical protein